MARGISSIQQRISIAPYFLLNPFDDNHNYKTWSSLDPQCACQVPCNHTKNHMAHQIIVLFGFRKITYANTCQIIWWIFRNQMIIRKTTEFVSRVPFTLHAVSCASYIKDPIGLLERGAMHIGGNDQQVHCGAKASELLVFSLHCGPGD